MKYVEIKTVEQAYNKVCHDTHQTLYCFNRKAYPDGPETGMPYVEIGCNDGMEMDIMMDRVRELSYILTDSMDNVGFTLKQKEVEAEGCAPLKGQPEIALHCYYRDKQSGRSLSITDLRYLIKIDSDKDVGYEQAQNAFQCLGNTPINRNLGFALVVSYDGVGIDILDCGVDNFDEQWDKVFKPSKAPAT